MGVQGPSVPSAPYSNQPRPSHPPSVTALNRPSWSPSTTNSPTVHFLRIARREMARTRIHVPLRVCQARLLEEHGSLGPAWHTPGGSEPANAFPYEA